MAGGPKPWKELGTSSGLTRNQKVKIPAKDRKRPPNKGAGRPPKPIDWVLIGNWILGGASGVQCASTLGFNPQCLYERCQKDLGIFWSEFYDNHKEKGNRMIHNKQFERAMKGSDKMLIHLGEHRLGQVKKLEQKIESNQTITQKAILEIPDNGRRYVTENVNGNPSNPLSQSTED